MSIYRENFWGIELYLLECFLKFLMLMCGMHYIADGCSNRWMNGRIGITIQISIDEIYKSVQKPLCVCVHAHVCVYVCVCLPVIVKIGNLKLWALRWFVTFAPHNYLQCTNKSHRFGGLQWTANCEQHILLLELLHWSVKVQ